MITKHDIVFEAVFLGLRDTRRTVLKSYCGAEPIGTAYRPPLGQIQRIRALVYTKNELLTLAALRSPIVPRTIPSLGIVATKIIDNYKIWFEDVLGPLT